MGIRQAPGAQRALKNLESRFCVPWGVAYYLMPGAGVSGVS